MIDFGDQEMRVDWAREHRWITDNDEGCDQGHSAPRKDDRRMQPSLSSPMFALTAKVPSQFGHMVEVGLEIATFGVLAVI